MRCWIREELEPGLNLAYEEAVLREGVEGGGFWLWRDAPSVIIGRNQIPENEVSVGFAHAHGIQVYRRRTGGGAVFHDGGVINFSFVVPSSCQVRDLLEAVLDSLCIGGAVSDRNDVQYRGFKVVGTAQRVLGVRRLFHGSILYDANLEVLASVLTPNAAKLIRHGVASVAARVANLKDLAHLELSTEEYLRVVSDRIVSARNWEMSVPVRPIAGIAPFAPCALQETVHA